MNLGVCDLECGGMEDEMSGRYINQRIIPDRTVVDVCA